MQSRAIYGLSQRHELATRVIDGSATRYAQADAALSVARGVVPGGGLMGMISSVTMRAPSVLGPMASELAVIYGVARPALSQPVIYRDERTTQIGAALAAEFDPAYLQKMAKEMAPDLGLGMASRFIPAVGGVLSALDTSVSATLTWRVATMAVLYLLNGAAWVGSKADTDSMALQIVGKPQRQLRGRVQLQNLPYQVGQVYWKMVDELVIDIRAQRALDASLTDERVRELLRGAGVSDDQIGAALGRC